MTNMFILPKEVEERLQIGKRSMTINDEIVEIFRRAKEEYGKTELSIHEITAAYYNIFTLGQGRKERNRKDITNRLFLMKSSTKKRAAILENAGRGKFKLCSKQG